MKNVYFLIFIFALSACVKNKFDGKHAIKGQVEANNIGRAATVFILQKPNLALGSTTTNTTRLIKILQTNATGNFIDSVLAENDHFYALALPADSQFDFSEPKEFTYGTDFIADITLSEAKKVTFSLKKAASDSITQVVIKRRFLGISGSQSFELDKEAIYLNRYQTNLATMNTDSLSLPLLWGNGTQFFEIRYLKNGNVHLITDSVMVNNLGTSSKAINL
jgi:hypothetical protein